VCRDGEGVGGLWRCGRSVVGCGGVEGVWWVVEVVVTVIILTVVFVAVRRYLQAQ